MPITVYRRFEADSAENARVDSMDVRDFCDEVQAGLDGFMPDYVEGYNETHHRGDALLKYIDWTAAYVEEMHRRGYKVCGFSFATGNPGLPFNGDPNPTDVQHLIDRKWAGCDAIGWHCYWGGQGFTLYNALRFQVADAQGPHPPFIIGECGRDAVEGGQSGWRASSVSDADYVREVQRYGALLAVQPYVIGAAVFTATPTADWASFSTEGLNLAGIPKLGPHCILPVGGQTLAWAQQATIVKQIDRTDVLRAVTSGAIQVSSPSDTPSTAWGSGPIEVAPTPTQDDQGPTYRCGDYSPRQWFEGYGYDVADSATFAKYAALADGQQGLSFSQVHDLIGAMADELHAGLEWLGDGFLRDFPTFDQAVRDGWAVTIGVQEHDLKAGQNYYHYIDVYGIQGDQFLIRDSYHVYDGEAGQELVATVHQAIRDNWDAVIVGLAFKLSAAPVAVDPGTGPGTVLAAPSRDDQLVTLLSVIGDKTYLNPPDLSGIQVLVQTAKVLLGAK